MGLKKDIIIAIFLLLICKGVWDYLAGSRYQGIIALGGTFAWVAILTHIGEFEHFGLLKEKMGDAE